MFFFNVKDYTMIILFMFT